MASADYSQMSSARQDQRHVGLRGAKAFGYFGLRHCPSESSDLADLFFGQQLVETSNESDVDGMLLIASVVDPFKICNDVIPFIAVDMIDDRHVVRIGNECFGNESVDIDVFGTFISPQTDFSITELLSSRTKKFSVAEPGFCARTEAVQASNAANVADFVESLEANNRAPLFIKHQMGPSSGSAYFTVLFSTSQGGNRCLYH